MCKDHKDAKVWFWASLIGGQFAWLWLRQSLYGNSIEQAGELCTHDHSGFAMLVMKFEINSVRHSVK